MSEVKTDTSSGGVLTEEGTDSTAGQYMSCGAASNSTVLYSCADLLPGLVRFSLLYRKYQTSTGKIRPPVAGGRQVSGFCGGLQRGLQWEGEGEGEGALVGFLIGSWIIVV